MSIPVSWINHFELLPYTQQVKTNRETGKIWCPVRRTWLHPTPEEWVRQALINFLIGQDIPVGRFSVEKKGDLSALSRYDLVIYNQNGQPFLLIECKRPETVYTSSHLMQMGSYFKDLSAPFIMWTNGVSAWVLDTKKSQFLTDIEECLHQYL